MTKETIVDSKTKFPYGSRLTVRYGSSTMCGTCMGTEIADHSYEGYMILKYDDNDQHSGHPAVNERGEKLQKCWWIEHGVRILKVELPFEPANICDIL